MSHKFVYVNGPRNQLIRACENCISTAIFDTTKEVWVPVAEDNGKRILASEPCNGSPSEVKKPVAADSRTGRVKHVCYCDECKGKSQHWQDDDNCYCKACRGKKSHY